ncbi:1-phosphofructokinase family hexose kinase [Celeribacter marinus]|uniref:1-phosphofructokinase family hexose kinase n=1 Tax=Celeribacter marinus TaxID=1397108 RepID=UPI003F6B205C
MAAIMTVTLNPTVDLSTSAPKIEPGPKLRCAAPVADPGGGGINVSRAINFLGGDSTAFIATGGDTGAKLLRLLAHEHVRFTAFCVAGETRQSIAVTDEQSGAQYRFVMPGPEWTDEMAHDALHAIEAAAPAGGIVVLSGSQPPGVAIDFPARLAQWLAPRGDRLFIDTSGAPLNELAARPAEPFVLRMDDIEAEDLAKGPLPTRAATADFAAQLVARGAAKNVIIARGSDGSTLVNKDGRWHCSRAIDPAQVVSAVGAGDSFVGAFCMALARGESLCEALRFGTAAASSAVMTAGTQLCDAADVTALLPDCELIDV